MPDPLRSIDSLVAALDDLLLHLGEKDLRIGANRFNSLLYFCLANACLRNKVLLLYGGMGANKTSLVNLLGCSFLKIPFDDVENLMLTGHPEQTEEKMIGFIDPRQWSSPNGEEMEILWTPWARSSWKVINEINRFPSGKQNIFIELLQKRKVTYAGQVLMPGDTCYFATMNPEFSATYPLDEALLDRISASVPATQPDLLSGLALAEREGEIADLAGELPTLGREEFLALPELVASQKLGSAVELAIVSLVRDFTLCERAPSNDKTELYGTGPSRGLCHGCHYFNNPEVLCWQVDQGLSDRARQDLRAFTKAFSFLCRAEGSTMEVLRVVAPYVIWHRVTPQRSLFLKPPYYGSRRLDLVKELVEKSIDRTLNERGEMNMILSRAIDGEIPFYQAIKELLEFDDPIARLDYIPALERMQ